MSIGTSAQRPGTALDADGGVRKADVPVGLVLAGGRSRRMGRDKALLLLAGDTPVTLLEHAVGRLHRLCPQVWVSCAAGQAYAGFSCVEDAPLPEELPDPELRGGGPLRGLVAGLARAAHEGRQGLLVLPCDMPLLPERLLRDLLTASARRTDALAVYYRTAAGWEEPLVGIYRCGALPFLRSALREGRCRVREVLPEERKGLIPLSEAEHALFANCNTPEQARALGVEASIPA